MENAAHSGDTDGVDEVRVRQLVASVQRRAPLDAVVLLDRESDATAGAVLEQVGHTLAIRILAAMPSQRAEALASRVASGIGPQWSANLQFAESTVGRLMEPPVCLLARDQTVGGAIETLRPHAHGEQLVYAYVVDDDGVLEGVVAMRELLFAERGDRLESVMVDRPFYFRGETSLSDAMRAVLNRHYPMYPVCDSEGHLIGVVRGYALFEKQTFELTAQPGRMVGVEKEEHASTPWWTCLRLRHPWLQLNLLTAFIAGAVVGLFDETIERVVALAAFLPVLAGQSGNTGCQALAVTLRGLILNEIKPGMERRLVAKEAMLGLCNGITVGFTAGIGMLIYAMSNDNPAAWMLAGIVVLAMTGSCVASGVAGVLVPLVLRRLGADPATASTIFLTTATDVVSMGLLLGFATLLVA